MVWILVKDEGLCDFVARISDVASVELLYCDLLLHIYHINSYHICYHLITRNTIVLCFFVLLLLYLYIRTCICKTYTCNYNTMCYIYMICSLTYIYTCIYVDIVVSYTTITYYCLLWDFLVTENWTLQQLISQYTPVAGNWKWWFLQGQLGGGFNFFLCSPLFGDMIQFH